MKKNYYDFLKDDILSNAETHPLYLHFILVLTLPMPRLFSSRAQGCKDFLNPSEPCHVGIHGIALAKDCRISTHMKGFHSFSGFLHLFALVKSATSSIYRAKCFPDVLYT